MTVEPILIRDLRVMVVIEMSLDELGHTFAAFMSRWHHSMKELVQGDTISE